MRVVHVPCGPFANASEHKAFNAVDQEIRKQSGDGTTYVLTNLTHPNLRGQADEIDMVIIGPGGAVVIEVKHWDASALRRVDLADPAAELIVAKAKRVAGKLRSADQRLGFVAPTFLLTRETGALKKNGQLPRHPMGVLAYGLKDVADLVAGAACAGPIDAKRLTDSLAGRYNLSDTARLKKLGRFDELALLTDEQDSFQRIFAARDPWTGDRVLLHTYDLSAAPQGEAPALTERRARREFDVVQRFQKSPHLPSLVDSWQAIPNYAGEMYFFSVGDSAATPVSVLGGDAGWTLPERREFVVRALSALEDFTESAEGPLLHRALDADSLRVRADNTPLFAGWRWARFTPAQTVSAAQRDKQLGVFAAPEIVSSGLAAATIKSDLYSLCSLLAELFTENVDEDVRSILLLGCHGDPTRRPSVRELLNLLEEQGFGEDVSLAEPSRVETVPPSRWDEGHCFRWKDSSFRVVSVLGQGSVGRTFKLEQLAADGEPIGTFVGKAIFNAEFGPSSLAAYQRIRPLSLQEGLSNILECASAWNASELTTLLRWSQGAPLNTWCGDLDFIAQVEGAETTEKLVIGWFEKLCRALDALHAQGWVHGDVSLSNILVDELKVVLIDYDLAGPIGYRPRSSGTLLYASPERREDGVALARDDVYSLATTLFHAITGRPPAIAANGLGLDWTVDERAAFPTLIPLLDLATGPVARRFASAGAALSMLLAGNNTAAPSISASNAPHAVQQPLRPNVVPRVKDILSTYPGSSFGNAETRGLDTEFAFDTYVPTALDQTLPAEIEAGEVSLVILCGNAGDGKTAFLQRLVKTLGGDPPPSSERVWSGDLAGRKAMINLDGAASWKGRSADNLLDELFEPFLDGSPRDGRVHLVAVNDGRLMEWIEHAEAEHDERPLTLALTAALSHQADGHLPYIRLVELNNRSLVGGMDVERGTISTEFVDELIRRLVGGDAAAEIWSPCRTCTAQARCSMKRSADMMGANSDPAVLADGARLRERLTQALQTVHQRNEIHITARELKAAISYILFGLNACEDLHRDAELEPHDPGDYAFNPESMARQGELLRELARLDPALEGHARVDRYLVGKGSPHPTHGARRFRDVVGRPLPLRAARRRAYLSWSADQVEAVGGDDHALTLRDGRRVSEFRQFPLLLAEDQARIKQRLCNGLSRLEALPDLAYLDPGRVPIRVVPRTPTETAFWIEKLASRFSLVAERFQPTAGLETLHRFLLLTYEPDHGGREELIIPLELYGLLMDLADGVQILDAFSDDVFANLGVFTNRLAQEDERTLNAWNPVDSDTVHQLGIVARSGRQTISLTNGIA
ncbi:protein kinase [Rhizobium laguerreae]|uniref:protein kinase domain-containing protein n=1 Tax=Rhizobium laguerreae TaxID=1076926 RepID=UPI001C92149C|nr:protein kinase [Rhizobium laguerreae]MBY3150287.1 protein kinase [Rhizobium laguerreae]